MGLVAASVARLGCWVLDSGIVSDKVAVAGVEMRAFCSGSRVMTRAATCNVRRSSVQTGDFARNILARGIGEVGKLFVGAEVKVRRLGI